MWVPKEPREHCQTWFPVGEEANTDMRPPTSKVKDFCGWIGCRPFGNLWSGRMVFTSGWWWCGVGH